MTRRWWMTFDAQGSWTAVHDLDEACEVLPTSGHTECEPASLHVPAELTLAMDGFAPWSDLGVYFQSLDASAPAFSAHGDLVVEEGGSLPADESWSFSLEATEHTLEVVLTAARIEEDSTQTIYTFATGSWSRLRRRDPQARRSCRLARPRSVAGSRLRKRMLARWRSDRTRQAVERARSSACEPPSGQASGRR